MQQKIEKRGEVAEQEMSLTTGVCRQEEGGPEPLLLKFKAYSTIDKLQMCQDPIEVCLVGLNAIIFL